MRIKKVYCLHLKESLLDVKVSPPEYERYIYRHNRAVYPAVCETLGVPIVPYGRENVADVLLVASFGSLTIGVIFRRYI